MNKRRPYKHTERFLKKKAEKAERRMKDLAMRKAEKLIEIQLKSGVISPTLLVYTQLEITYGISEMEMLFGSNDAYLQKRILVARQYLREIYEKDKEPTFQGLEAYFQDYAIEEYCRAIGMNRDIYDSLCGKTQKESFLRSAVNFTYYFEKIEDKIKNIVNRQDCELVKLAQENYEELVKIDLRKGSTERRNSKRFELIKIILKRFEELSSKSLSIRRLSKEIHANRNSVGKYYNAIQSMLMLGMEINEHSFDEEKKGRKPNPYSVISEEILMQLEKDLEDIPGKCGLNYASWTGDAIHEYLKIFYNLDVSMPYLYNFLRIHDIVSKSASRKNPNANPEEIEAFKRSLYKKFRYAIKHNLTVVFLDETHVQQGSRTQGFAKKGKEAVYSYHTENLHCEYTLLTLIGFDFVMIFKHKGSMKSEDYVLYLEELHKKYPEKNFLIFRDNARIHTSHEVSDKLKESGTDKFIEFESIPPYCPELNPVELMNNEFKGELKRYECANRNEVSQRTDDFIEKFQDSERNSKKLGRRKARAYIKGKDCVFIFKEYNRAMGDIHKDNLRSKRNEKMSRICNIGQY